MSPRITLLVDGKPVAVTHLRCPCCFDEAESPGISPRVALATLVQGNGICARHEAEILQLAELTLEVAATTLRVRIPPA